MRNKPRSVPEVSARNCVRSVLASSVLLIFVYSCSASAALELVATFDSLEPGSGVRGYRKMDVFLETGKDRVKKIDHEFNIWEIEAGMALPGGDGPAIVQKQQNNPVLINCNILAVDEFRGDTEFLLRKSRENAIRSLQREDKPYNFGPYWQSSTAWQSNTGSLQAICKTIIKLSAVGGITDLVPASSREKKVDLRHKAGVFEIPARVNGEITLYFILDSGASDVSLPKSVAAILKSNGSLTSADTRGAVNYQIANGGTMQGTKVIIRSIEIGGQTWNNVEGSIVDGPPLLGQSFLKRLKGWSIDSSKAIFKFQP